MIRLRRPDEPTGFASAVAVAHEAIEKLIQAGKNPEDEDFVSKWRVFKDVFENAHDRKCAYCESRFGATYPGDVEHYRPKTMVKDATTRGDRDDTKNQSPGRKFGKAVKPGYWWLAYGLALGQDNTLWQNRCLSRLLGQADYLTSTASSPQIGEERFEQVHHLPHGHMILHIHLPARPLHRHIRA